MAGTKSLSTVALEAHNHLRRLHKDTGDLEWDNNLANGAEEWAKHLLKTGTMDHDRGSFGENIYKTGRKYYDSSDVVKLAVKKWYDEISDYNFRDPKNSEGDPGNFTQVVWKGTTKVGMGFAQTVINGKDTSIVVARYDQGNTIGAYKYNVMVKKIID